MSELQNELNQDIFSDDKAIKKGYSSTKIKARNFLTNVSYNRIKATDYKNKDFVIDCFTFLLLYLNPFYLERKFETEIEREFVNTLWTFLMPSNLYTYICQSENMKTLNKIKIKYQDAKDILLDFLKEESNNNDDVGFNVLSSFLEKDAILYQFLYGNLFLKCFSRVNDYGIRAKTLFNTYYTNFNVQKKIIDWQNNNLKIKEEENGETTPINMTTLDDENKEVKIKNDEVKIENDENEIEVDNNNKNETNDLRKKKVEKRKINNEKKEKKRELKKQRLLKQLNENTEKLQKLKKSKKIR